MSNHDRSPANPQRSPSARPAFRRSSAFLTLVAILCALALGAAGAQNDEQSPLRRLVERLMGPYAYADFEIDLLPEALPADLPIDLPLLPDATLIGSMERRDTAGTLLGAQVILDSQLNAEEILGFYLSAFEQIGWLGDIGGKPSGFLEPFTSIGAGFCSPGVGFIWVNTFAPGDAPTDVRLDLNFAPEYVYCPYSGDGPPEPEAAPLPPLTAPAGSRVTGHGLTLLPDQSSSSALITSIPPGSQLHDHYGAELERNGWQLLEIVTSDEAGTIISRWANSEAEEWEAVLSLIPTKVGVYGSVVVTGR